MRGDKFFLFQSNIFLHFILFRIRFCVWVPIYKAHGKRGFFREGSGVQIVTDGHLGVLLCVCLCERLEEKLQIRQQRWDQFKGGKGTFYVLFFDKDYGRYIQRRSAFPVQRGTLTTGGCFSRFFFFTLFLVDFSRRASDFC